MKISIQKKIPKFEHNYIMYTMKKIILLFFFFTNVIYAQQDRQIEGLILDQNNQPLESVNIFFKEQPKNGISSNQNGYFLLENKEGYYHLSIRYLGYQSKDIPVHLDKNKYLIINLKETTTNINEVIITVKQTTKKELKKLIGYHKITLKNLDKVPMIFGEKDLLKAIQILPGVNTSSEAGAGFSIHGGSIDQNLILLDGAPIYHPTHLLGFFSVFVPNAVQDLKLYKSAIPPSYGNRLSSILDVTGRKGNNKTLHYGGDIGLISAQAFVEGPIKKNKSSFLVTARRTYADLYTPYLKDEDIKNSKVNFYDLTAKFDFILSQKTEVSFSAYKGRDVYNPNNKFDMDYGNEMASIHLKHQFSSKLRSTTSFIYSLYDYNITSKDKMNDQYYDFGISLAISSKNVKQDFKYYINRKNKLNFGADLYYHSIKPGDVQNKTNPNENAIIPDRFASEIDFYANHQTKIGKALNISYGLRASIFSSLGPGKFYKYNELGETTDTLYADKYKPVKTYYTFAPRIAMNINVNKSTTVKMSYDKTYQFLHYLISDVTTTPTDLWMPSGINLKPQSSNQYNLSFNKTMGDKYIISIGGYYRDIQHITDYRIGTTLSLKDNIEQDLLQGEGYAYGLEFFLQKTLGKFTASLAYTYSKTRKHFPEINEGKWYPAAEDRPHDINISGSYKLSKRAQFSAMWVYYTGRPITYPAGTYLLNVYPIIFFSHRNANRLPDYHRLDLSFTLKNKPFKMVDNKMVKKKYESYWNFSIYNAYAHDNTFMVNYKFNDDTQSIDAYKVTLFKFVPSISYHIKF